MYVNGYSPTSLSVSCSALPPPVAVELIVAGQLHHYWPFLRRGLDAIVQKVHPDWIPEDVYVSLRANNAQAYIIYGEGTPVGFLIAYLERRSFNNALDLFIWAGWSLPMKEMEMLGFNAGQTLMIEQYAVNHLRTLAQQQGEAKPEDKIRKIMYLSPRPGMSRRAEKWGFHKTLVRYELEV